MAPVVRAPGRVLEAEVHLHLLEKRVREVLPPVVPERLEEDEPEAPGRSTGAPLLTKEQRLRSGRGGERKCLDAFCLDKLFKRDSRKA